MLRESRKKIYSQKKSARRYDTGSTQSVVCVCTTILLTHTNKHMQKGPSVHVGTRGDDEKALKKRDPVLIGRVWRTFSK